MWGLDHKEGWAPKNWCFRTVVLDKTLRSSLDCKEIKSVCPKGNQPLIFIGRTDAEAPILWPPDAKSWLIGKNPDAGKDWRHEEKGVTEDEVAGCHQWTGVWANFGRLWGTGKPGVLQTMMSQRVRHDWATGRRRPSQENTKSKGLNYFWSRKSMGKKGYKCIYKCLNYFLNMYTFHRQLNLKGGFHIHF